MERTLVLHGDRDENVPFAHGEELAGAARRGRLYVMHCGHNDCPRQWAEVRRFLTDNAVLSPSGGGTDG